MKIERSAPDFFSPQVSESRRFYLSLDPADDAPLSVVCGGSEHCTADYAIHRENFPYHSIEYIVRGKGTVKLRGVLHSLQAGSLFSYGPAIRHDITSDAKDPLVKYFVDFRGRKAGALLKSCGLAPGKALRIFPPHEAQAIFDELIRCGLRNTRHSGELCARLLGCLAMKIADSVGPSDGIETRAFATYQNCRQHIEKHFQTLKSLDQIALACHVDAAYLCRLFRRFDHQSPYQYLLRLKMSRAAEMLQSPAALIKQVAEQAGFSDPFHFSRTFKKIFGVSPDDFRRLR